MLTLVPLILYCVGAIEAEADKLIDTVCFAIRNTYQRFEFAEHLVRLFFMSDTNGSMTGKLLSFSESVVFCDASLKISPADAKAANGTIAVVLLVLLKQYIFLATHRDEIDDEIYGVLKPRDVSYSLSIDFLKRCVAIFLRLLGSLERISDDRDPFVQVKYYDCIVTFTYRNEKD